MERSTTFDIVRVTEITAIASYNWIGLGDKNKADEAAVNAMREMLNSLSIHGQVVIGEGEIDKAPMLHIGEQVGDINSEIKVDIAVDPIEGTKMVALGQSNAISVIVLAEKNSLLSAPDMYMEKLVVGSIYSKYIDLNKGVIYSIENIIKNTDKNYNDFRVAILYKPRHYDIIEKIQKLGVRVYCIPDGDVLASLMAISSESDIDMLYGIGGAPEGIVSAAAVRALDGNFQGRLLLRKDVKGDTEENILLSNEEEKRCKSMNVEVNKVYNLEELVKSDEIIFSATGITNSDFVRGVEREGKLVTTDTIVIRGKSKTIRHIYAKHNLDKENMSKILKRVLR